jgi:formiminotetrahydrofolate cyclodeaminase
VNVAANRALTELSIADFLDQLASGSPTPGGGSAAALSGALAAALGSMVCNLTLGKSQFADVADEIQKLLDETEAARAGLALGVEADAEAFGKVAAAYKLPNSTEPDKLARLAAIRHGSIAATRVPLEAARVCARVLDLCSRLAEIGNPRVLSDVVVGAFLALGALHSCAANVRVNLPSIKGDAFWDEARTELDRLLEGRTAQVETIVARVSHRG